MGVRVDLRTTDRFNNQLFGAKFLPLSARRTREGLANASFGITATGHGIYIAQTTIGRNAVAATLSRPAASRASERTAA